MITKYWTTAPELIANFCGFAIVVCYMFTIVYRFLNIQTLEKYFVSQLYWQPTKDDLFDEEDRNSSPKLRLLALAKASLKSRTKIAESKYTWLNHLITSYSRLMSAGFKQTYKFEKARQKLASELDVKRILTTLRYLRSAVRLLTTEDERKLLRLQAKPVIVDETINTKKQLERPLLSMSLH